MDNGNLALSPARIRENRKRLGMTLDQFGQHIRAVGKRGNAPRKWTISRWENGVKRPGALYASTLITIDRKLRARKDGQGEPESERVAPDGGPRGDGAAARPDQVHEVLGHEGGVDGQPQP